MKLSNRTKDVPGSPTLALAAKAIELKNKGVDVVSLSVGEPDWETFDVCKSAGVAAIKNGMTRYTSASGMAGLKKSLVEKYQKRFSLELDIKNVMVSPGAKYAIQQALWALTNPGEKVGVFIPFWASYSTMIEISGGLPELISLNDDFSLNEKNLIKSLESGVKVLLINSPNNPSGSVFDHEDYKRLAKILNDFPDVQVILDDIYSDLYWGDEKECPHLLDQTLHLFNRVLIISGASKAYSMTGWRIGWAVGSKEVIGAMSRYQSQTTGCPNAIAQEATRVGIEESEGEIKSSVEKLKARCEKGVEIINALPGMSTKTPTGAFYFWINIKALLEEFSLTDKVFCEKLLETKAVVLVPGTDFGQPGFVRASFAVSPEVFAEGFDRVKLFIDELRA